MSGVSMFMAVFVVGSTFGFVVASRRRQLGLLRLVGATPRQVRRMVLGEAAVVALLAAVVGCLLAAVATPAFLALARVARAPAPRSRSARRRGWPGRSPLPPGSRSRCSAPGAPPSGRPGSRRWRCSRRPWSSGAGPACGSWSIAFVCLGGAATLMVLARGLNPVFALVIGILMPEVVVLGLYCLGGWIFPGLAALVARPFAGRDVSARLARDHVRTAVRTPGRARRTDPRHLGDRRLDDGDAQLRRRLGHRAGPRAAGHAVRRGDRR